MALWWISIKLPLTTRLDHPNTLTPNTWTAWFFFHTNILGNETGKTFSRCEGEFDKDCLLVCPFFAKAPPWSSRYRFPPSRLFGPARITTRLCLWRLPGAAGSHPKEPLPPHPSRRSPAEPPALILSSSCFLTDFGNWLVRMGNSPFPSSPILQMLVFKGLVSRIMAVFLNPSATLQTDQFLIALFLTVFVWSLAWVRFPSLFSSKGVFFPLL